MKSILLNKKLELKLLNKILFIKSFYISIISNYFYYIYLAWRCFYYY